MTSGGGANSNGTIFSIMPDGTGYVKLLDFAGINGKYPYGSLIFDGTFLDGMTSAGGTSNKGTIFKIQPNGSGFVKLLDFTGVANGENPRGALFSDGTFLYGMTIQGGLSWGILFKIKPDGSNYTKLLDFTGVTDGTSSYGTVISDGTFLYGMAEYGGTNDYGTIFKIKPDGSGFIKLHDFLGGTDGDDPKGALVYDGTFLYGMTDHGGVYNFGTVFRIKPDGTAYFKLLDFSGAINGSYPYLGSIITDGNFLFGMTRSGGIGNHGTIFKYGIVTDITEHNSKSDIDLFPNPTTGVFSIHNSEKIKSIEVFNLIGKKLYGSIINADTFEVDLSNFPNGVYFINISTDRSSVVKKVAINK
jgi:uncharacterized repeat protein (TIGR03803 family)